MRVVAPHTSVGTLGRPTSRRAARGANLEALGLCCGSCVVLLGLWLTVWGRGVATPADAGDAGRTSPAPLHLRALSAPEDLLPLLPPRISGEPARRAAATALFRRATDTDVPLDRVGALAFVTAGEGAPRAVLSAADVAALKPRVIVRTRQEHRRSLVRAVAWFLGAFWFAHLVRRWRGADDDPVLLPALLLLSGIGLVTMVALRDPLRDALVASTFAAGVGMGIAALLLASEIDWESSPLRRAVRLPLALALALAALLLVFGSGPGSSDVKVNLLGVQPVEAIRMLVVFALAGALARRLDHIRELSEPARPGHQWMAWVRMPRWRDVRPVVASMALVLTFFFLQKDLGPALVLSGVVLALYAVARGRVAFVFVGLGLLVAGFAVAYAIGVPATVGHRVRIWLDPWNNGVPGGNQIAHGLWGMATGGAWGSGAGMGTAQSIPEAHTDFVLAAIGEELGLAGVLVVVSLYVLLAWRCLRVALRAPGDYTAMLTIGLTLALVVQALVIAGGLFGMLPLTGVVTPFLSYGRSSMLANCVAVGIVLAVARRRGPVRTSVQRPVQILGGTLAMLACVVAGRAAWVQVLHADELASAASLSEQADGGYRYEYNPRLVAAARQLPRGSIYDRNGLVLATSVPREMAAVAATFEAAGLSPLHTCQASPARCYPLGGVTFPVTGDWATQANWGAPNSSYVERDMDRRLKGFDDRQRLVAVTRPRTGRVEQTVRRDYSALLPIVRRGITSSHPDVRLLLERARDVQTTLDARLQLQVARALRHGVQRGGHARGAAVVIDVDSGDVLASVSHPWPDADAADAAPGATADAQATFDRVRYGLYPPGSTFKLLVAAAALRSRPDLQSTPFLCERLPGGRVGQHVRGWSRPVRDDVLDTRAHGQTELRRGLVHSCNAYFAQLAVRLGPASIIDAASVFQIAAAQPATTTALRQKLPHAGYGQGDVLASPLKMARVAAAIAGDGRVLPLRWTLDTDVDADAAPRLVSERDARLLAAYMREAVTSGSGRSLARHGVAIAGKTGTAEVDGAPAHSWFVGFAPADGPRRIAFAVIIENAGYGGRTAAPIAGDIVEAATRLGLTGARPSKAHETEAGG